MLSRNSAHPDAALSHRLRNARITTTSFELASCLQLSMQPIWQGLSLPLKQVAFRLSMQWTEREIAEELGTSRRQVVKAKRQLQREFAPFARPQSL